MADRGKRLDEVTVRQIRRLRDWLGVKGAARELRLSRNTVRKYARDGLKFDPPNGQDYAR